MYLLSIDGILYGKRNGKPSATRDSEPFTLVEAMREVHGCGNAKVHRANGSLVVRDAGSTVNPWVHVPSGRRINHRSTLWARQRYQTAMAERNATHRAAYAL